MTAPAQHTPRTMTRDDENGHRLTTDTVGLDASPEFILEAAEAFERELDAERSAHAETLAALEQSATELESYRSLIMSEYEGRDGLSGGALEAYDKAGGVLLAARAAIARAKGGRS